MQIIIYSHKTDLIYEAGNSTTGFKVNLLEIMFKNIYFFWGMNQFSATNKGCPITIYLSDSFLVYNKVIYILENFNKFKLFFSSRTSFPLGSYKLMFNLNGIDLI